LLRDADGDGVAEWFFVKGVELTLGMALVGHDLYVANTDAIMPQERTAAPLTSL
jgi:glucose/arabinose dehydrogenase